MPAAPSENPAGTLVVSTPASYAHLSRLSKSGRAVRLAPGLYVTGSTLTLAKVVRHHIWEIIDHYWPGAVVCDRTVFDGGSGDWIFICQPEPARKSDLILEGVSVSCRIGPGPLPGDTQWMGTSLWLASPARALLENTRPAGRPAKARPSRVAGLEAVGDEIDALVSSTNGDRLASTFALFDQITASFDQAEVLQVRALLAAASGTYSGSKIESKRLLARVDGTPYDAARVALFGRAATELDAMAPRVGHNARSSAEEQWLPFYEAYFSNYIEGTRFSVEEAYSIAVEGNVPEARPADAYDVSATYEIVSSAELMREVPRDADDLIELLEQRHRVLMAARPEKNPGVFKTAANYAGATAFVAPMQVEGTLRAGWDSVDTLIDPLHRAVMLMFLVSECHPFDDGNGRVTRILANAELVSRGQHRIVIPNSYRSNYLAALTAATAGNGMASLTSVLNFACKWVSVVDWSEWERCRAELDSSNAFEDPGVAEHSGRRLRLPGAP